MIFDHLKKNTVLWVMENTWQQQHKDWGGGEWKHTAIRFFYYRCGVIVSFGGRLVSLKIFTTNLKAVTHTHTCAHTT